MKNECIFIIIKKDYKNIKIYKINYFSETLNETFLYFDIQMILIFNFLGMN